MLLSTYGNTVGFESNIKLNSDCTSNKYHLVIGSLQKSYSTVQFVNFSMSALEIFGTSSESLLSMLTDLHFDEKTKHNVILKARNTTVRCSYCNFCRRNKSWTNPDWPDFERHGYINSNTFLQLLFIVCLCLCLCLCVCFTYIEQTCQLYTALM